MFSCDEFPCSFRLQLGSLFWRLIALLDMVLGLELV
jgi:hypothetical protein